MLKISKERIEGLLDFYQGKSVPVEILTRIHNDTASVLIEVADLRHRVQKLEVVCEQARIFASIVWAKTSSYGPWEGVVKRQFHRLAKQLKENGFGTVESGVHERTTEKDRVAALEIIISHAIAFATSWSSSLGSDCKFWEYTTRNQFRDLVASLASNGFDVSAIDHPLPGSTPTGS